MAVPPNTSRITKCFARVEMQAQLPFGWWIADVGPRRNQSELSEPNFWESKAKSVQDSSK